MKHISVVIPTYRRPDALRRCLDGLARQSLPLTQFEVLVVDDGSGAETVAALKAAVPSYPFPLRILSQPNQGPAAARNRGIAQAEAPCIAFTDDDCVPEPGWLAALLAAWTGDADCAGLGGRTLRLEAHPLARYIDYIGSLQPSRHPEGHLNYVVTCNALFRRDALQAVGGFDTRITWAGGEEPILGAELRAAGYYFSEAPLAEVRHQHPRGWRALFRMYHRYGRGEWAGSQLGARRGYSGNLLYFIKLFLLDGLYILIRPQVSLRDKLPFLFFSTVKALGSVRGWSHQRKAAGAWPSPKFPLQTTSHDA